ncbi:DNA polymerase IV [Klebsiella grimontii]|uniref:DNA polymerase IV n=1 Tax=Klebsiella grimontii TaxID=2058152 RepID=A0A7H4P9P3_9ENTR|nr:DNA polymerase IV [Klebsiella grimontii]
MRKIIHVDMDCFFAAVEMRDNPALRDIPIAIGGSRVQRGCDQYGQLSGA